MNNEIDYNKLFSTMKKQRRLDICRKCHFLIEKDDKTYFCGNVSHFFGHPWSFQTRYSLKQEWFEKATINFQYRDLCIQLKDEKKDE